MKFKTYGCLFHYVNLAAFIFLLFSNSITDYGNTHGNLNFIEDKLWGFWICVSIGILLIIFDSFILIKMRKNKTGV